MSSENIQQQINLYGQPLADRFGAVMAAFQLSQRRLAQVLGLSAPMLSQLINGQRIKIGNPAVYQRLVMLEEAGSAADPEEVLRRVGASQPVLSTTQAAAAESTYRTALQVISGTASPQMLRSISARIEAEAPALAHLLREASGMQGRAAAAFERPAGAPPAPAGGSDRGAGYVI